MDSRIKNFIERDKGTWNPRTKSWDFPEDIGIPDYLVKNGRLLIRFGTVGGNFDCSYNSLASLEGCPKEVNGSFDCSGNHLTSLKGAPKEIEGNFVCAGNQLTSLKGCPKEVGGSFSCDFNSLTSIEGCPEKVDGYFGCSHNNLTSLEGCPKEVRDFYCSYNKLTSLKDCPKKVNGDFYCFENPLKSVSEIFNSEISGAFYIDDMFSNLQLDESNQFLIEAANILKNRFELVQDKLAMKVSRESLEELEDILKTATKLKLNFKR